MTRGCGRFRSVVKLSLISVVIAAATRAGALDPQKAITQYIQTVWTTDAGLPQTSVYSVAQTSDGYLWVGTEQGLARFDGMRFTVFNSQNTPALPSNYIHRLLATHDGALWIGTDSGLTRYKDGSWRTWTAKQGMSNEDIQALAEGQDGSVWVGTDEGLDRLRNGTVAVSRTRNGLPNGPVRDLKVDGRGILWVVAQGSLASFDGTRFTSWSEPRAKAATGFAAVAIAGDGAAWAESADGRLARIAGGSVIWQAARLPRGDVQAMLFDKDGNLWMGFPAIGIARLHDGLLTRFDTSSGLPGQTVNALLEDKEHNLWVGTEQGGLAQLRDGKFTVYGRPEGFSANLGFCVAPAGDGSVWFGTQLGELNQLLPDGQVRIYTKRDGLSGEMIHSMVLGESGTLWIGSRHGVLTRFREGRFKNYQDPLAANHAIDGLLEDREGRLWVGSYGAGLARFENGRFIPVTTTGAVTGIVQSPDGAIWAGTDGDGVIRISGEMNTRYTTTNGLAGDHVYAILADQDGVVWAGTTRGLSRIQNGRITSYTPSQGLFDAMVGNLVEDRLGYLWIGSDNGISRVKLWELDDFAAGRLSAVHSTFYDTADGLRSRETMSGATGAGARGPDGRLWFPTVNGLAVVDPAVALKPDPPLRVRIEGVSFGERELALGGDLHVGPGADRLMIQYTALSFLAPTRIRFRYRLEGYDEGWIDAGNGRSASYTNLPPGRYTFRLEAARHNGEWGPEATVLAFTMVPPWYRSRLAISSFVFAAILLTWFFVEMRTSSLKRRRDELESQVVERTGQLEIEKQGLMRAREALQFQAAHDSLTGLWSRSAILDQLARELERATRQRTVLSVIVGDLDHFKVINDTYGHLSGDFVLRESAHRLVELMRGYDAVGRYGGEEFLIVLPGYDAAKNPARAQELVDVLASRPFDCNGTEISVTCSYGVTITQPWLDRTTVDDLIRRADKALYEAKRNGRNRVEFDPLYAPAKAKR